MNVYPNSFKAWVRTREMARNAGVDLAGAVFEGWLTRRDLDGLVCACAACGQERTCSDWHSSHAPQTDLPAFCSNKSEIESLRL
jgi:hypothetical protein